MKKIIVIIIFILALAATAAYFFKQSPVVPQPVPQTREIKLFFYDPKIDSDGSGNVLCSRQGLVAVTRIIPFTDTPIQDAVRREIAGQPTGEETARGTTTEFPLPGFELKGANLADGVLTLEFADPQNKTSGGACRAGILWFQIEAAAKQFPGVNEVRFIPETLFQP